MCTHFQLFRNNCTHVEERENIDNSLINFLADHRDIILDQFGATLPSCFKEVTNKEVTNKVSDNEINKGKKTKKQKKEEMKQKKRGGHNRDLELAIKNKHQCKDFKMQEGANSEARVQDQV